MPLKQVHQLSQVFAVLKPDLSVDTLPLSPTFYAQLDEKYNLFKGHVLIAEHEFTEDWPTWERHPAGDEMVMLLSGEAEMILRNNGQDERLSLTKPGSYVVIKKGLWHTAKVSLPTRMLFITPGEGTENSTEV